MNYFSALKNSILHPTEFFSELKESESGASKALITFLLSSFFLVGTIFLGEIIFGSDLIYSFFDYQANTFIFQQYTTFQFFGLYIGSNQYLLLFFDKIFFLVKMWLLVIGVIYLTGLILQEKKHLNITKTFEVLAWSSTPLIMLAGITILFLGIRFIIPLYYHWVYYFIVLCFLVIIIPAYIIVGLGKTSSISFFRRMVLTFSPIVVIYVLWTLNHADILLGHIM
jgi:Yip1 domain